MMTGSRLARLALLPLLIHLGCDVQPQEAAFDDELEVRLAATPIPGWLEPYHGRWEGPMTQVDGIADLDYDATILMAPDMCTVVGGDILRAEWDYYNVGAVCTSELDPMGMSIAPDGTRTWTFFDTNVSGPCINGYVDLTETADPAVMVHTWRYIGGSVDAQGLVNRVGLCGSGQN